MGDFLAGGPGLSGVPGREREFRDAFAKALEDARILGARALHLGPSRVPAGVPRERCLEAYVENTEHALALSDVPLLVEPLNAVDNPTVLHSDFDATAELLRTRFGGRLKLQFDAYHAAMNGLDPAAAFRKHLPLVGHVQFADVPGRGPPGSGNVDFGAFFAAVDDSGYGGYVAAEYMPKVPTAETLGWMEALAGRP